MSNSAHNMYWDASPFYRKMVETHGHRIPVVVAERVAANHFTTLDLLAEDEGLEVGETVGALDLITCLGY